MSFIYVKIVYLDSEKLHGELLQRVGGPVAQDAHYSVLHLYTKCDLYRRVQRIFHWRGC